MDDEKELKHNLILIFFFRCEIVEDVIETPVCVNVTDIETEEVCELVDADSTPPTPTAPPPECFKKECKRVDTTTLGIDSDWVWKKFVKMILFLSFFSVKECKPVTYEECEVEIIEQSTETKCQNYTTTKIEQECRNKTEETCRQDFEYICHEYKKPHYGYPKPKPKPIGNLNSLFLAPDRH